MLTLKPGYQIVYYNDRVFNAIKKLPKKLLARYIVLTERMELLGPFIGMPHSRALGDGLFELRVKAQEGIVRVFYGLVVKNEIIILHSFVKKSQQIPKKEIALAERRLKEVLKNGKK